MKIHLFRCMPNHSLSRFITEILQQEATKIIEPKRSGLSIDQLGLKPHGGVFNIVTVYNQATPEEKEYWGRWYHNAKSDVEDLAKQYNLPFPVTAAIVAVLSPGNRWNGNLIAAERLISGSSRINSYPRQIQRAKNILQTGDVGLVTGPKVTVFFNSLMNPKKVEKDMVLDGHAINIWRGEKRNVKGTATPVGKKRDAMIQDYQTAAEQLGVPVQAVQAVTWYIWKYTGKTAPLEAPTGVYDVSRFKNAQPANDVSLDEVNAVGAGGIVGAGMGNAGTNASKKLMWSGDKPIKETFYHGTSTILGLKPGMTLLPPDQTEKISEKGRKKNLDKVFFTKDLGSAKIYAGRAVNQFGGKPTIFSVEPVGEVELINATPGSTVFMSPSAKITNKLLESFFPDATTDDGWYYHATNQENAFDILSDGQMVPHAPDFGTEQDIWPDGSTALRSYFGPSPRHVESFYPEGSPALLRVPATAARFKKESGTRDFFTNQSIPASVIEFWNPNIKEWQPLKALENSLVEQITSTIIESVSNDHYLTLADLYGRYNTPDEDELLWEYVHIDDYSTVPFKIVHVNPTELVFTKRNKHFLDPSNMHKSDKARVKEFEKIAEELSKRTIIVVHGEDIVDGFHRTVAMSNKSITTVRALDLSQPKNQ